GLAVRDRACPRRRHRHILRTRVDHDEVVAEPMHLVEGEAHRARLRGGPRFSPLPSGSYAILRSLRMRSPAGAARRLTGSRLRSASMARTWPTSIGLPKCQ